MPVPRRRHSSARRRRGRTHKKLTAAQSIVVCPSCGTARVPHRVCANCGEFQGRTYKVKKGKAAAGEQA